MNEISTFETSAVSWWEPTLIVLLLIFATIIGSIVVTLLGIVLLCVLICKNVVVALRKLF